MEGIPNEFNVERKGVRIFIRRPDRFVPWLRRPTHGSEKFQGELDGNLSDKNVEIS